MHSLAGPAIAGALSSLDYRAVEASRVQPASCAACNPPQVDMARLHAQLGMHSRPYAQLLTVCSAASTFLPCHRPDDSQNPRSEQRRLHGQHERAALLLSEHGQWELLPSSAAQEEWFLHPPHPPLPAYTACISPDISPASLLHLSHLGADALGQVTCQLSSENAAQLLISLAHHSQAGSTPQLFSADPSQPSQPAQPATLPDACAYALVCRSLLQRAQLGAGSACPLLQPHQVSLLCWACGVLCSHLALAAGTLDQQEHAAAPQLRRRRQWHARRAQRVVSFASLAQQAPGPDDSASTHHQYAVPDNELVSQTCHALRSCAARAASALEPALMTTTQWHGSQQGQLHANAAQLQQLTEQPQQDHTFNASRSPGDSASSSPASVARAVAAAADAKCLTQMICNLAVLGLRPAARWRRSYFAASSALLTQSAGEQRHQYTAQELAATLWALAKLRLFPPPAYMVALQQALELRLGSASQQSLANSLWALGKLKIMPSAKLLSAWCVQFTATFSQQAQTGAEQPCTAASAHSADCDRATAACQQHHISQSLWAMATLQAKPCHVWLADLLARSAPTLQHASAQSLSNTMWALAELGHTPAAAWTASFFAASAPHVPHMPPQGVCNTLQGLVQSQVVVPESWIQSLTATCASAVQQGQYSARQLASLMWALSQLGRSVDERLVKVAVRASCWHLQHCSGSGGQGSGWLPNTVPPTQAHRNTSGQRASSMAMPSHDATSTVQTRSWARAARRATSTSSRSQQQQQSPDMQPTRRKLFIAAAAGRHSTTGTTGGRSHRVAAAGFHAASRGVPLPTVAAVAMGNGAGHAPAVALVPLGLHDLAHERGGLPVALRMKLLRNLARREQRVRVSRRFTASATPHTSLRHLDPLTLSRLLHGIAAAVTGSPEPQLPRPPWRVACALALRATMRSMDARSLALALPAAVSLGVRPPVPPARRALYRVTRDAQLHDSNHLVTLLAALVKNPNLAQGRWLLHCIQRLEGLTPHLSCAAVVQLAAILPALEARRPGMAEPSQGSGDLLADRQAAARRASLAAEWQGSVHALAHAVVLRAVPHVTSMGLADMQVVLAGVAGLMPLDVSHQQQGQAQLSNGRDRDSTAGTAWQQRSAVCDSASHRRRYARSIETRPVRRYPSAQHPSNTTPADCHPLQHLLEALVPRLPLLPAVQLVHLLQSTSQHAGPGRAPLNFLAAAETASLARVAHTCLAGGQKVQLLQSLCQMGHLPPPAWVDAWYRATLPQLCRLSPHHLATALRLAEEIGRVAGHATPDAAWLRMAAIGADVAAKAAVWAVNKQLPPFSPLPNSNTSPPNDMASVDSCVGLSDLEVQLLGSAAGDVIAIASRLHALKAPELSPALQRLMQGHAQLVRTAATGGVVPTGALLHALHELRGLQPSACPAWAQEETKAILTALLATDPRELFLQIWAHAAISTGGESASTVTAVYSISADGARVLAPPPRAAVAAAHRVIELFMALVRWGMPPPAAWLQCALRQASARIGCFTGPQAAALLRTLALMGPPSEALETPTLQQLLAGCLAAMRAHCSSAQLTEVGWALSVLQVAPSNSWWLAYEEELLVRMGGMPAEPLCEIMWAFGSLRRRPSKAWMEGFARALLPQLSSCTADQLARLIWSLAAVEEVPTAAFGERYLSASAQALQVAGSFSAQSLTLMIGGLAALRVLPRADWMARFVTQLGSVLPHCRAIHVSKMMSSLAILGHTLDDNMLRAVIHVAAVRAPEMDTGAAAQITWAVSRLDSTPGQMHLRSLVDALERAHCTRPLPGRRVASRPGVGVRSRQATGSGGERSSGTRPRLSRGSSRPQSSRAGRQRAETTSEPSQAFDEAHESEARHAEEAEKAGEQDGSANAAPPGSMHRAGGSPRSSPLRRSKSPGSAAARAR